MKSYGLPLAECDKDLLFDALKLRELFAECLSSIDDLPKLYKFRTLMGDGLGLGFMKFDSTSSGQWFCTDFFFSFFPHQTQSRKVFPFFCQHQKKKASPFCHARGLLLTKQQPPPSTKRHEFSTKIIPGNKKNVYESLKKVFFSRLPMWQ